MVLYCRVDFNLLAEKQKDYPWQKPACCPCCQGPLWWHGFVVVYFYLFPQGLFLKRLRCPNCKAVHRLRPDTHWSRFQTSIASIRSSIAWRAEKKRWRPDLPRANQIQWRKRLRRMTAAVLGSSFAASLLAAFDALAAKGFIPASSRVKCEKAAVN